MNRYIYRLVVIAFLVNLSACSGDRDKDANKGKDRPVPAKPVPADNK
jgi:hypothetical protein